jgi:hypothetical protein
MLVALSTKMKFLARPKNFYTRLRRMATLLQSIVTKLGADPAQVATDRDLVKLVNPFYVNPFSLPEFVTRLSADEQVYILRLRRHSRHTG